MRIVIVGAGIAGLAAARELVDRSGGPDRADVIVVDKAPSPGGRVATRRVGSATFDHGAQFFTVRTAAFRKRVDEWIARGLVHPWNHGFGDEDGHPRYVARRGMTAIADDLAAGVHVECSTMAFALRSPAPATDVRWNVVIDDGTVRPADRVIITAPLPQAFGLLADAELALDPQLFRTDYDRTVCLMAVLDRSVTISPSGGVQPVDDVFSFIGDNESKGLSTVPALTFHANPAWSEQHWDLAADRLSDLLSDAAQRWIGDASITRCEVKKWRFATPRSVSPDPCWISDDRSIVIAGDAFAGPRIEGAHNSGLAAAHAVLNG